MIMMEDLAPRTMLEGGEQGGENQPFLGVLVESELGLQSGVVLEFYYFSQNYSNNHKARAIVNANKKKRCHQVYGFYYGQRNAS